MAGKREIKRNRRKLPAILVMLAASAELLTPAGPAGAAQGRGQVDSNKTIEIVERRREDATKIVQQKQVKTTEIVQKELFGPVPESEAVEDAYFEDAVFLGDSRTEGFHLYSGLEAGTYFYAVGATVESVFTKKNYDLGNGEQVPLLDAMAGQACDKIYIMLGINELGWSKTETFHDQYAKLIDRVREDHPEAKIALQSIPPVSAKQDAKETYVNNARIRTYNGVIQALAEEEGCYFLDVAACLTGEGGVLPVEQTTDGVHFNTAGCRTWLGYLRTHSLEAGPAAAREAAERPPDAPARPEGRSVGPA